MEGEANGAMDAGDHYSNAAVEHWVSSIRSLADNPRVCAHFRMTEATMANLVDELIAGAARLDLRGRVANDIRPAIQPQARLRDLVVKPALLAANTIDAFVFELGYDKLPAAERPARRNAPNAKVFDAPPPMEFPKLEEQPSSFDEQFYADWFTAYLDFVARNSESVAGRSIDVEQNGRIGAILGSLGATAAAAAP
jgi:hypothetical protein